MYCVWRYHRTSVIIVAHPAIVSQDFVALLGNVEEVLKIIKKQDEDEEKKEEDDDEDETKKKKKKTMLRNANK